MENYNEQLTASMILAKIVNALIAKGDYKNAWKTYKQDDDQFKSCKSYREFLRAVK